MELSRFDIYLIAVNAFGFILFAATSLLFKTAYKWSGRVLMTAALAGAAPGIFISSMIFDPDGTKSKHKKDIMMSRVLIICMTVIEAVIVLIIKGFIRDELTFDLIGFFNEHRCLPVYLAAVNIITFAAFGIDKRRAAKSGSRIRIMTLLSLAFIGGSVGALLGMLVFRHKTKKNYFSIGIPMMLVMQLLVMFYLMNMRFR